MYEIFVNIIVDFWDVLSEMAPYLMFGFAVAGILSVAVSQEIVERNLGKKNIWSVIKAALFGVPLPLCSCGVIPVTASLRRHGASKGATTAFLISTPQTGVDSILVTYSLLGPVFAVFRPLIALINGIFGGFLIDLFSKNHIKNGRHEDDTPPKCEDDCCVYNPKEGKFVRALKYGFITLPSDIGKELLIGLGIAALITTLIPNDFFASYLKPGFMSMFAMMIIGLPVYVCATASVPIAAAFILKGISPGAALVFLMTGPATNAAAITTIWKVLGKRTTFIYLFTVAVTALISGFLLDQIFIVSQSQIHHSGHSLLPLSVKYLSAVALLVILVYAIYRPKKKINTIEKEESDMRNFIVQGMTCSHCVENVKRAVLSVKGVKSAQVELKTGLVQVEGSEASQSEINSAVESIGYKVAEDSISSE
jgi:hypothetical protein